MATSKKAKRDLHLLLGLGAKLFPADAKTKKPIIKGWQDEATGDVEKLRRWARKFPGCAWGVACGPSDFHVIDVDGVHGELSILDKELPPTLEVRTQSGNRHLYYRGKTASRNARPDDEIKKVDFKSVGGLVIAPGSLGYEIAEERPIADAPAWSVEYCGRPGRRERGTDVLSDDEPADVERAGRWLGSTADPSVEGEGGNDNAFRVACRVKDFGVSEHTCLDLMMGDWNERCEPPWDLMELAEVVENAYQYAWGDQGGLSADEDFGDGDDLPTEEHIEEIRAKERDSRSSGDRDRPPLEDRRALLEWMNGRHSKTLYGGKSLVWTKQFGENGRSEFTLVTLEELAKLYENRFVPTEDKAVPLGMWWRKHPALMWSKGFAMRPDLPPGSQGMGKEFNIWNGWGIEPRPGDWTPYRRLVTEALCAGDERHAGYVFDWIALLLQRPSVLHKVALVFRGSKGTGKSTLGLALKMALGNHAAKADSAEAVTGQFNWHLKDKVFLLAEEVKWMKGKGGEGMLKALITDPERGYEAKGINAVQGYNYVSMMITSNEDWVVPASLGDERRFAAFNVSRRLTGDRALWRGIYDDSAGSGVPRREPIAAMMHELLRRDISGFDPIRHAPRTEALAQQALESMDFKDKWWHDRLSDGQPPGLMGEPDEWERGGVEVPVQEAYRDFTDSVQRGHKCSRDALGRRLSDFGVKKRRATREVDGKRPYIWILPSLEEAREIFARVLGTDVEW